MVDTVRTEAALQTLLADNTSQAISPQDMRDFLVSAWTPGWMRYLDHRLPNETGHDDDDFFKDDTKTGITEVTVSGTATWTELNGVLSVAYDNQTAGDAAVALKALTPSSAPVTFETAISGLLTAQDFTSVGLCFTDGTTATNNIALARYHQGSAGSRYRNGSGTLTDYTAGTNGEIAVPSPISPNGRVYMRIIWTAANSFSVRFSPDGVTWTNFDDADADFPKTMTPTHFGAFVSTQGGATQNVASFDYFRIYEADLA